MFRCKFRYANLLLLDVARLIQLAASDQCLLQEKALLAAVDGTAANFIAGVADGRIWVQSGLLGAGFGSANLGFRLAQRGIGFGGEALGVGEAEEFFPDCCARPRIG